MGVGGSSDGKRREEWVIGGDRDREGRVPPLLEDRSRSRHKGSPEPTQQPYTRTMPCLYLSSLLLIPVLLALTGKSATRWIGHDRGSGELTGDGATYQLCILVPGR